MDSDFSRIFTKIVHFTQDILVQLLNTYLIYDYIAVVDAGAPT